MKIELSLVKELQGESKCLKGYQSSTELFKKSTGEIDRQVLTAN